MEMMDNAKMIPRSQNVLLNPIVNSKGVFEKGEGITKDDFVPLLNKDIKELSTTVDRAIRG